MAYRIREMSAVTSTWKWENSQSEWDNLKIQKIKQVTDERINYKLYKFILRMIKMTIRKTH